MGWNGFLLEIAHRLELGKHACIWGLAPQCYEESCQKMKNPWRRTLTPPTAFFTIRMSSISIVIRTRRFCSLCTLREQPLRTVLLSCKKSNVAIKYTMAQTVFHKKMSLFQMDWRTEGRRVSCCCCSCGGGGCVRLRHPIGGGFSGLAVSRVDANRRDMTAIPSPRQWCIRKTICAGAFPDVVPFSTWHSHSGRV